MKLIKDICYGKDCRVVKCLDIYLPDNESFKVFVYMHGGGIENGDKSDVKEVGKYVAERGIAFVEACGHTVLYLFDVAVDGIVGYTQAVDFAESQEGAETERRGRVGLDKCVTD